MITEFYNGITIWQRQADGSWKILYDLNSPDLDL